MSVLLRQEKEDNKERLTLQLNELTKKISLLEERYMLKKLTGIRGRTLKIVWEKHYHLALN